MEPLSRGDNIGGTTRGGALDTLAGGTTLTRGGTTREGSMDALSEETTTGAPQGEGQWTLFQEGK